VVYFRLLFEVDLNENAIFDVRILKKWQKMCNIEFYFITLRH
jgi:hypothetical protein